MKKRYGAIFKIEPAGGVSSYGLTQFLYWHKIPTMRAKKIKHDKITDELGNTVEIKTWSVPLTPDKPEGYKYSLVYIVGGKRVVGYDNTEGK